MLKQIFALATIVGVALLSPAHGQEAQFVWLGEIHIASDGDFLTHPAVAGGNGSKHNPFIIRQWHIIPDPQTIQNPGLSIRGTDAHVHVQDLTIAARLPGQYGSSIGILLENATNVTISGSHVYSSGLGVAALRSQAIRIHHNSISGPASLPAPVIVSCAAVHIAWSEGLQISDNKLTNSAQGISVVASKNLTISGNNIEDISFSYAISLSASESLLLYDNRIESAAGGVYGKASTCKFTNNEIHDSRVAFYLQNSTCLLENNRVKTERMNVYAGSVMIGNSIDVGVLTITQVSGHDLNNIYVNEVRNTGSNAVDLTETFWGSPDGPTGVRFVGPISYTPWAVTAHQSELSSPDA